MTDEHTQVAPWWVPPFPVMMGFALYILTWWLLWQLSPAKGQEPSELFKLLAQAVVLTAFVNGAVGAVYVASRDGQRKNDIIAQQAKVLADQSVTAQTPGTTTTTTTTTGDQPAPGTATITAAPDVDITVRDADPKP